VENETIERRGRAFFDLFFEGSPNFFDSLRVKKRRGNNIEWVEEAGQKADDKEAATPSLDAHQSLFFSSNGAKSRRRRS
jgi:hypothetical protein